MNFNFLQKFFGKQLNQNLRMIPFGETEYGLFTFNQFLQSLRDLWLLDLLDYAVICGIMFFLGSRETCIGTWKLTGIGDLKTA